MKICVKTPVVDGPEFAVADEAPVSLVPIYVRWHGGENCCIDCAAPLEWRYSRATRRGQWYDAGTERPHHCFMAYVRQARGTSNSA